MVPRQPWHLLIPLVLALSTALGAEPQLRVLVDEGAALRVVPGAVSYTHLTLPTKA